MSVYSQAISEIKINKTPPKRARNSENLEEITFYTQDGNPFSDKIHSLETARGNEFVAQNDHNSCAKKEVYSTGEAYYVKMVCAGFNSGTFYNPWSNMTNARETRITFDNRTGKRYYEYKEVAKDVFDAYIKFLITRNRAHLRNAERMVINQ